MIRNLGLVILISLLVATQSTSERSEQSNADEKVVNHFRCNDWGDSIQKVKDSEKIPPDSEGKEEGEEDNVYRLRYKDTLLGRTVYVGYVFFNDKLFMGNYLFVTEYENHSEHALEDYFKLKLALTEKYSEPIQIPLDENHLKSSGWKINIKERDTTIMLGIMKKDYSKFALSVSYFDDKIFDEYMKMLEEQEEQKKRELDKELNRARNKL